MRKIMYYLIMVADAMMVINLLVNVATGIIMIVN